MVTKKNEAVEMEKVKDDENLQSKTAKRRGVSTARGTTRLKFSHEQAKPNGLFIAHLDSVSVNSMQINEDRAGMPSFAGLEIPRLVMTFASNEEDANKRHYITLNFNAVESNVTTIPGGKDEWKVNSVFDWLKHILNVYLKGRELTKEEETALLLPYMDFDNEGEYVAVETEDVVAGWKTLFENFENIINRGNDGKPYYKDVNGKNIPVWIKLVRYIKNNKKGWQAVNNGDLAFPTFVGEGCIELFTPNVAPSIRLNSIREAIIPMKIEEPKAPNFQVGTVPNMNAGVTIGEMPVGGINANNIGIEAMEDMPF